MTTPDPLKMARDALAFYADESRYHGTNVPLEAPDKWSAEVGLQTYRLDVTRDRGVIASKALAAIDALPASVQTGGSAEHMLQDQNRDLSRWLSNQPGARLHATEATAAIAQASVPSGEPATFDAEGFRAWVARELPDDTIIGRSAWWADHLTKCVQWFIRPATAPAAPAVAAPEPLTRAELDRLLGQFARLCAFGGDTEARRAAGEAIINAALGTAPTTQEPQR